MDGGKAAREHELQQALEKEKEKRIEALGSQGLKRMLNQKLAIEKYRMVVRLVPSNV